ncbi:477b03a4-87cb-45d6-94fe-abdbdc2e73c8 [Sclerotinia trifoliorum]|uniref:NADH dehydrogenase [ubiquinone] 1 beta subcomplex subunit 11, mitochondrial n=1 Tax=Sclerotinia trifoliorum TaxID=28548 RepID=A0A8H2VY16_9HELO|nr:477b03a4-87cb-45d6-94fe-abdbdc2e73c8 [Sclerotinia trifoliorum]
MHCKKAPVHNGKNKVKLRKKSTGNERRQIGGAETTNNSVLAKLPTDSHQATQQPHHRHRHQPPNNSTSTLYPPSKPAISQSFFPPIAKFSKMSFTRAIPRASTIIRTQTPVLNQARNLSSTAARKSADHGDHYDPPTGWLFGVKPGEKPEKEGWENLWVYGFFGACAFGVVGYAVKPDTSIQTWALEEARRRLEVEGILKEPEDKS